MSLGREGLLADLRRVVVDVQDRTGSLQAVADLLRRHGAYRWVGLYEVNWAMGSVSIIVWSGPGAPEHPTFPIPMGLTGAAIAQRKTMNTGDVASDPRYLTAFGSTRSEIIVPVFNHAGEVVGTIDIESENSDAFGSDVQALLEECAEVTRPLWEQ
jgi:L-methionine (R)-S-oxide reductase